MIDGSVENDPIIQSFMPTETPASNQNSLVKFEYILLRLYNP